MNQQVEGAAQIAMSSPEKADETKALFEQIEQANKPVTGIAICGSHPQTIVKAPFDQADWRIYACSPHNIEHRKLPRVDEWFEVHYPIWDNTRSFFYLESLKEYPVWMRLPEKPESKPENEQKAAHLQAAQDVWENQRRSIAEFKDARLYPELAMKRKFSPFHFTSSIAYIMAKAIDDCERMKIPAIGLWGIMQRSKTEYTYQRPGIQYFIWEAQRRGIDVYAPEETGLFEPPPDNW